MSWWYHSVCVTRMLMLSLTKMPKNSSVSCGHWRLQGDGYWMAMRASCTPLGPTSHLFGSAVIWFPAGAGVRRPNLVTADTEQQEWRVRRRGGGGLQGEQGGHLWLTWRLPFICWTRRPPLPDVINKETKEIASDGIRTPSQVWWGRWNLSLLRWVGIKCHLSQGCTGPK